MAFSSDFEQLLDEYKIDVSDRTRRMIRRNIEKNVGERTKRQIQRNNALVKKTEEKHIFVQFICAVWVCVYFILSLILKITLGIIAAIVWMCLYLLTKMIEIYCVLLVLHITTVAMKQYQSS